MAALSILCEDSFAWPVGISGYSMVLKQSDLLGFEASRQHISVQRYSSSGFAALSGRMDDYGVESFLCSQILTSGPPSLAAKQVRNPLNLL